MLNFCLSWLLLVLFGYLLVNIAICNWFVPCQRYRRPKFGHYFVKKSQNGISCNPRNSICTNILFGGELALPQFNSWYLTNVLWFLLSNCTFIAKIGPVCRFMRLLAVTVPELIFQIQLRLLGPISCAGIFIACSAHRPTDQMNEWMGRAMLSRFSRCRGNVCVSATSCLVCSYGLTNMCMENFQPRRTSNSSSSSNGNSTKNTKIQTDMGALTYTYTVAHMNTAIETQRNMNHTHTMR